MRKSVLSLVSVFVLGFALSACAGPKPANAVLAQADENVMIFTNRTFANQNLSDLIRRQDGKTAIRLEFQRCTFQGVTSLSSLPNAYQAFPSGLFFRDCTFEGEINFQAISFPGQVDFSKCQLKKGLICRNAVFMAPMGFRECGFDGEAGFQNCIFMKECTWLGSVFYSYALFQGSRFMKTSQFQNVRFMANSDFTQCRFDEGGVFDFCIATGKLDFSESRQEGLMTFRKSVLQKGLYLNRFRSFGPLRLFETQLEDSLYHRDFRWFAEAPESHGLQGKAAASAGF